MKAHQQQVVDERMELDVKITALGKFIESDAYDRVELEETLRLESQFAVMKAYACILATRIHHFY